MGRDMKYMCNYCHKEKTKDEMFKELYCMKNTQTNEEGCLIVCHDCSYYHETEGEKKFEAFKEEITKSKTRRVLDKIVKLFNPN